MSSEKFSPLWLELAFNFPLRNSFWYKTEEFPQEEKDTLTGRRAEVMFGSRKIHGFILSAADVFPPDLPVRPEEVKSVLRVIDREPLFGQQEIALARWMASFYLCTFGETLSAMLPSGRREKALPDGFFPEEQVFAPQARRTLSAEQEEAVARLTDKENFTAGKGGKLFYLKGITGSGKTEVFLRAAEILLKQGKSVIYLVPEISLTHQVVEEVRARFGNLAAVLHSGLTPAQKFAQWTSIRRGEARIVVGARSAVFAPVQNPGLIVIDEEQDGSYKSGNAPRYHARQVAMHRCAQENCVLVMGSATPSLEAWYQIRQGNIEALTLSRRLSGGEPPSVSVVQLAPGQNALSGELKKEIAAAKEQGKQTVLFLNRRGFSHIFQCRTCGFELKCRNCSVPMTWHKAKNRMQCHYCGWQTPPPQVCPSCGSLDIRYLGFGTEYVENELREEFPDLSIQRADTDAVKKKGSLKKILTDFRNGKTDILLGTQMIAKGLNFPGVTLVGVILADATLRVPDFRAAERTFSLLVQVAGRAGRFSAGGKVLIQTWDAKTPAVAYAAAGDITRFYEQELRERKLLDFPPCTRLIRFLFRGKTAGAAETCAEEAAGTLRRLLPAGSEILGPAECPLSMIAGNHRFHLLVKCKNLAGTLPAAAKFAASWRGPPGVYLETDVDPVSIL